MAVNYTNLRRLRASSRGACELASSATTVRAKSRNREANPARPNSVAARLLDHNRERAPTGLVAGGTGPITAPDDLRVSLGG
jgi:hypothetical protein